MLTRKRARNSRVAADAIDSEPRSESEVRSSLLSPGARGDGADDSGRPKLDRAQSSSEAETCRGASARQQPWTKLTGGGGVHGEASAGAGTIYWDVAVVLLQIRQEEMRR